MSEDDNEGMAGFRFIDPAELLKQQRRMFDHRDMAVQEFRQSVDRLVDELTPDQAFTLYRLLQNISSQGTGVADFFSGQLSIILRRIHKICVSCGNTEHTTEEHLLGEMEQSEVGGKFDRVKPEDKEEDFRNWPDDGLNDEQLRRKYNVHPLDRQGHMYAVCNDCEQEYPSVRARAEQGLQCPACKVRWPERFDGKTD